MITFLVSVRVRVAELRGSALSSLVDRAGARSLDNVIVRLRHQIAESGGLEHGFVVEEHVGPVPHGEAVGLSVDESMVPLPVIELRFETRGQVLVEGQERAHGVEAADRRVVHVEHVRQRLGHLLLDHRVDELLPRNVRHFRPSRSGGKPRTSRWRAATQLCPGPGSHVKTFRVIGAATAAPPMSTSNRNTTNACLPFLILSSFCEFRKLKHTFRLLSRRRCSVSWQESDQPPCRLRAISSLVSLMPLPSSKPPVAHISAPVI